MANIPVSTAIDNLLKSTTSTAVTTAQALTALGAATKGDASIAAADLAPNAVIEAKIADGAVTAGKIGALAVTSGKLAVGAAVANIVDDTLPVAKVTGTLPVAKGGTGAATLTANNVLIGAGTSSPTFVAPSTAGNVLTSNGTTWVSSGGTTPTNETVNTAINTDPAETRYALSVERKQNFGAAIQNLRGQTSKNLRVVTFGDSLVAQGTPLNLSGVIPSAGGSCEAEGSINVAGATTIVNDWTNPGGRYANIPALGTRRFARYSPSASAAPFHHASIFKVYYVKNTGTFKLRSSTGVGKTISIAPTIAGTTVTVTTSAAHGFSVNNEVTIQGVLFTNGTDPNGVVIVTTVPSTTSFTYTLPSGAGPYAITSGGTSTFPTAAIFIDVGKPITAASLSGTTVTITCSAHGFAAGDEVIIQNITGFGGTTPNGKFAIATIVNVNSFTYTLTGGSGTYTVTSNPKAVAVVNTAGTAGTIGVYTVAMTPNGSNFYRVDVECLTGTVKILYVHALVDTSAGRDSYHLSCLGLGGSFDSEWVQCLQPNWTTVLTAIDPHLIVFKAADFHIGNKTLAGDWATVLTRIRTAAPNAVILLIDNHPWQDNPDPAVDNTAWSAGLKAYAALYAPMVQFVECRKFFPSYAKMVEFGFIGESDGIHLSDGIGRLFESSLVLDHVSTLTVAPHVNELPNIKIFSRLAGVTGTVKSAFQSGPEWGVTGDLTNANGYIGMFNQLGTGLNPNVGAHLTNFATAATNNKVASGLALGLTRTSHQLLVQSRVNNRIIIGNLGDAEATFSARDSNAQLEVLGTLATVPTFSVGAVVSQTADMVEFRTSASLAAAGTKVSGVRFDGIPFLASFTTTARDLLTSVPAGSVIFNSTTSKLNFYTGSAWEAVTSA